MYRYYAKLIKVIDGDTIDALVDLGFHIEVRMRFRLARINTPEIRTLDLDEKARGMQAKARLIELLKSANNEFQIQSTKTGKYGRWLGDLFIKDKNNFDVSINKILLDEGLAEEYL